MDYNRIGSFIASERKAKKLTQAKLAELIFVSEKTISKWENGNGIPDTNSLPKLCEVFDVSLNELLNGERMNNEEYKSKAEEELLKLQKQKEDMDRFLLNIEIVFGVISIVSFLSIYYFAIYMIDQLNIILLPTIMMIIGIVILFASVIVFLRIEQKAGYYVCAKCGHKHIPTYSKVCWAMHFGRTRYMKCPHCQQKSWNKKVIK